MSKKSGSKDNDSSTSGSMYNLFSTSTTRSSKVSMFSDENSNSDTLNVGHRPLNTGYFYNTNRNSNVKTNNNNNNDSYSDGFNPTFTSTSFTSSNQFENKISDSASRAYNTVN
jgi:hypothetical protein